MLAPEEREPVYYQKGGLLITRSRMEYKGKLYAAAYIYSAEKETRRAGKPWEFLYLGLALAVLELCRYLYIEQQKPWVLPLFILGVALWVAAWRRFVKNTPYYGIIVTTSTNETISLSFGGSEEDQERAFLALGESIAFWHRNEDGKRTARWHSDTEGDYIEDAKGRRS
ncbi:MAG: hypothetical protein ACE3JP_06955 [Ectobacillus sp.]